MLLKLKDHERPAFIAVMKRGEASATTIALDVGIARARASVLLNEFVRLGLLERRRVQKEIIFSVKGKRNGVANDDQNC